MRSCRLQGSRGWSFPATSSTSSRCAAPSGSVRARRASVRCSSPRRSGWARRSRLRCAIRCPKISGRWPACSRSSDRCCKGRRWGRCSGSWPRGCSANTTSRFPGKRAPARCCSWCPTSPGSNATGRWTRPSSGRRSRSMRSRTGSSSGGRGRPRTSPRWWTISSRRSPWTSARSRSVSPHSTRPIRRPWSGRWAARVATRCSAPSWTTSNG